MNVIRSREREFFPEQVNKTALSAWDDKRIIVESGIDTLAYRIGEQLWVSWICNKDSDFFILCS